jgi:hypothetical protein
MFSEEQRQAARLTFVFDITLSILSILRSISEESGIDCLLLPLLSAGTSLQYLTALNSKALDDFRPCPDLHRDFASIRQIRSTVDHWRAFVRSRILLIYRRIGLHPIRWTAKHVEEVWSRADLENATRTTKPPDMIHWMDIMVELGLETLAW